MAYRHYGAERGRVANGRIRLDAIPPDLVGNIKIEELVARFWRALQDKGREAPNIIDNLRWISDPIHYRRALQAMRSKDANGHVNEPITEASYLQHLQDLTTWGICHQRELSKVIATNRYFAVHKTPTTARAIVDCAAFSKALKEVTAVEKVRLPTIPDLLRRLEKEIQRSYNGKQKYGILLSDLRHFFHQIPLEEEVREFFTVKLKQVAFVWNVLPMGHTVSPVVAQTISYAILLMCGFTAEGGIAKMPSFATRPGAVAAVWYDNLMSAGQLDSINDAANRWKQQASQVGATLKYTSVFTGRSLSKDGNDCDDEGNEVRPIALGLRLACDAGALFFRHKQANITEWTAQATTMQGNRTPSLREMARLLGVIMFDAYVATASDTWRSNSYPKWIAAGKRIGRLAFIRGSRKRPSWDSLANYPESSNDRQLLIESVRDISINPWRKVASDPPPDFLMCSDASTDRWGAIWWRPNEDTAIRVLGGKWNPMSHRLHISAKEAVAALLSLKNAPADVANCVVRVAIDAQAIVYALRRRASGSRTLQGIIDRIFAIAADRKIRLQFIWIEGKRNAADVITRPENWGGLSISRIDWQSDDASGRLRDTLTTLRAESVPLVGCEEEDAEEIIERFCDEEDSCDKAAGYRYASEQLSSLASKEGQG